jgi:hypothetical protein
MPKQSKHPRLRVHIRRGKGGQVWTSYSYDMRGTGRPDVALGTDYAAALVEWAKLRDNLPRIRGTIEEAFQRFEADVLPVKYKNETTRRNYAQSIKTMRPVFGPATWDSVRVSTIEDYLEKRSAKVQANREKAVLSVVWGYARRWDMTALPFPAFKMNLKNTEEAAEVDWTDRMFAAMYVHAEPFLRDAMDLMSATAWRVRDALKCQITDVRDGVLHFRASKTKKRGHFTIEESLVLQQLIKQRLAIKAPHFKMLTRGNREVSERMLTDAWARARAKALPDCPEVQGLLLRYVRKYSGQLAGSLQEAQQLLQHGSAATTARHYRGSEKLRPVR